MVALQNRIATLEAATGTAEVRSQPEEKAAGESTAFHFKGLTIIPGGFLSSTALVRTPTQGGALGSQAKESTALGLEAQAALLQSQLEYVQAADEMDTAIGRRPR